MKKLICCFHLAFFLYIIIFYLYFYLFFARDGNVNFAGESRNKYTNKVTK